MNFVKFINKLRNVFIATSHTLAQAKYQVYDRTDQFQNVQN